MRSGETVRLRLPNWMDARRCGLERQLDFGCRIAELDGRAEMRSGETVRLRLPNWMRSGGRAELETPGDAVWRDS